MFELLIQLPLSFSLLIDLPYAEDAANEAREILMSNDSDYIMKTSGLPSVLLPNHEFRFEDVYLISAAKRTNLTSTCLFAFSNSFLFI